MEYNIRIYNFVSNTDFKILIKCQSIMKSSLFYVISSEAEYILKAISEHWKLKPLRSVNVKSAWDLIWRSFEGMFKLNFWESVKANDYIHHPFYEYIILSSVHVFGSSLAAVDRACYQYNYSTKNLRSTGMERSFFSQNFNEIVCVCNYKTLVSYIL